MRKENRNKKKKKIEEREVCKKENRIIYIKIKIEE